MSDAPIPYRSRDSVDDILKQLGLKKVRLGYSKKYKKDVWSVDRHPKYYSGSEDGIFGWLEADGLIEKVVEIHVGDKVRLNWKSHYHEDDPDYEPPHAEYGVAVYREEEGITGDVDIYAAVYPCGVHPDSPDFKFAKPFTLRYYETSWTKGWGEYEPG